MKLPQVTTKLVWDNAALISPATAKQLGISQGEMARVAQRRQSDQGAGVYCAWSSQRFDLIGAGFGRACNGLGEGKAAIVGRNAAPLRTTAAMHVIKNISVKGTSEPYKLATTQDHFAIDKLGADETAKRSMMLIREGTLEQIAEEGYIEHKASTIPS